MLSLATFIAGALCPMLLADLGAEVIKLEPLDGDPFRVGTTFGFLGWNRGTRSLALDLRRPEGREVFFELVRRADVLVDNYRPGVLARLGIDGASLDAANARLVHTSITGYGEVGPLAERPCFDPIMQARSGLVRAQGGEEPVFHQVAYTDYSTATLAAFATVAALAARCAHPERGERVSASLLGSALLMQAGAFIEWPERPADPPGGSAVRGTSPTHRAYAARDGWIFVAAHAADERVRLARALGIDELTEGTLALRFMERSRAEALAHLAAERVPAVACAGFPEITRDDSSIDRRLWWDSTHPELGEIRQTGYVIELSETPMRLGPVAPRIGQHTREVLLEAGLDERRIEALIEAGVARV